MRMTEEHGSEIRSGTLRIFEDSTTQNWSDIMEIIQSAVKYCNCNKEASVWHISD